MEDSSEQGPCWYINIGSLVQATARWSWTRWVNFSHSFLALLDYVSRAHEIKIRPSSVVCPSVRLWRRLSLKLLHGFLSIFCCGFPWAICLDVFFIFEKKRHFLIFYEYFSFSLTWDPMGAKPSKRYSSLKKLLNLFKLLLNFLLSGAHKSTVLDFWNFEFRIFHEFFSFLLTWDSMGAKTSKRYSSLKSLLNLFKLFLNFLLSGPRKSTVLDFWNIEFPIFNEFFTFHHCTLSGNQKPQLSGKRETLERNGVKFGPQGWVFSVYRALLRLKCVR